MDTWKFFDITHREHLICNPSDPRRYQQLVDLLRLAPGAVVATSDSAVLLAASRTFDLTRYLVETRVPNAWMVSI